MTDLAQNSRDCVVLMLHIGADFELPCTTSQNQHQIAQIQKSAKHKKGDKCFIAGKCRMNIQT